MAKYFVKRVLYIIPVLIAVLLLFALVSYALPGMGFAKPVSALDFLKGFFPFFRGLITNSPANQQPSAQLTGNFSAVAAVGQILLLTAVSIIISLLIAIPLGRASAAHQNRWQDKLISAISAALSSVPVFFVSYLLLPLLILMVTRPGAQDRHTWIFSLITVVFFSLSASVRVVKFFALDSAGESEANRRANSFRELKAYCRAAIQEKPAAFASAAKGFSWQIFSGVAVVEASLLMGAAYSHQSSAGLGFVALLALAVMIFSILTDYFIARRSTKYREMLINSRFAGAEEKVRLILEKKAYRESFPRIGGHEAGAKSNKNPVIITCLVLFAAVCLICVLAPYIAKHSPFGSNLQLRLQAPNPEHIFGTDEFGRDVFARLLYGGRRTVGIAFVAVLAAAAAGAVIGLISSLIGGKADLVIMRLNDMVSAVPGIWLALLNVLSFGTKHFALAIALAAAPAFIRLFRNFALNWKNRSLASDEAPGGKKRISRYAGAFFTQFTGSIADSVIICSVLGFLGLGLQPPSPEWGQIAAGAKTYLRTYPHLFVLPCVALFICVFLLRLMSTSHRSGKIR